MPLPGRDTLPVPPVVLVVPPGDNSAQAVLAGVLEGAAAGAAYGAELAYRRPDCAPSSSPGDATAQGAVFGGVWGGLRGLLGRRHARVPAVLTGDENVPRVAPRPDPGRAPALPPLADARCLARPVNTPEGAR
ncbi:MAG TPA: hypothetical protein VFJ16_03035 [Longimicrobium sp.]|nr:hypothetical protein [Longimicrobium sp.]